MQTQDPSFPPLLTGHAIAAGDDAFAHAVSRAASGKAGAGDLFWSRSLDHLSAAIVLEPESDEVTSVQMLFAAMVAFADAFGAIAPAGIGMFYSWPGRLLVNGAHIGDVRIGIADAPRGASPPWLVVGLAIRMLLDLGPAEPGERPDISSLEEEGAGEVTCTGLLESFSRHFLAWINTWQEDGFAPVRAAWLERAEGHGKDITLDWHGRQLRGRFAAIDETGNLILETGAGVETLDVMDIVARTPGVGA